MAKQQISKTKVANALKRAGIAVEVRGRGNDWRIECADRRESLTVKRALRKAGIRVGGWLAGWGGWVWDNVDRSSHAYTTDYCDVASIHHY